MMTREYKPKKYEVGCSGSGWGVWECATGNKVYGSDSGREWGRIEALKVCYELNGWNIPKGGFR